MTDQPLTCPKCGKPAEISTTRFGRRDTCAACGLHSWDGKTMVAQEVHDARKHCRAIFDLLWSDAETMYGIEEPRGTPEYDKAVERVRRSARARAYRYMAFVTGLPEPECHMADQTDIEKLRTLWSAAKAATPEVIRTWWKNEGEAWWAAQKTSAKKEVA